MSKFVLTFGMFILLFLPSVFAQTLQDYILETRGDTLVVKDDNDYGAVNTLPAVLNADTLNVPAGRVYLLHNTGIYTVMNNPTTSNSRKVIIMGETQTSLKLNKGGFPAILQGGVVGTTTNTFSITSGKDLLLKNVDVEIASTSGSLGWAGLGTNASCRLQVDNCIIEHNQWVCTNPSSGSDLFYTNDYFVNLDGHTCRRNGGVLDFFNNQDTVLVQNCTHINTQGTIYKFRLGHAVNRVIFNHNDFINCSGSPFMNYGGYSNFSVTNNIFVNAQVQCFAPILYAKDTGEIDLDTLAMGLVNVYVDSTFKANGAKFYADRNLTYWDPTFDDMTTTLNAGKINGATNWVSQRIAMNSRTKALFADKTNHPYLTNGTWYENVKPTFKNTDVLFSTQLAVLKSYSLSCVDTTFTGSLASWRQASNPQADYFCYADWPIPVDLSYTDTNLLTAGLNSFPVGDLNWFPTQNAAWKAQESTELAQIAAVLETGRIVGAVEKTTGGPQQFQLHQNYPNPFNPTTVISYSIPKAGYVSLKVYNMLGQEVATLVNSYKAAQTYSVEFDASKFASGVYIYSIKFNNQSLTHKMVLMK